MVWPRLSIRLGRRCGPISVTARPAAGAGRGNPKVAMVSMTGSVARKHGRCGEKYHQSVPELGGKAPAIVMDDADLVGGSGECIWASHRACNCASSGSMFSTGIYDRFRQPPR
ncbi:aldehyde dehydrogenase family protein [Klebsiella pneumoniae]|nr:aldehyde dehydrogenase family protein [Klebsiella pneumoniae]